MSFDYATLMNQHAMLQVRCQYWEKECIKLAAERDRLKAALDHILAMQTRGFVTLGDKANELCVAALSTAKEPSHDA